MTWTPPRLRTVRMPVTCALVAGVLAVTTGAARPAPDATAAPENDAAQRVIITLSDDAAIGRTPEHARLGDAKNAVAAARSEVAAEQDAVLAEVDKAGIDVTDVQHHDLLVNAIVVTVSGTDVERLAELPGVEAVHPDAPIAMHTDVSVPLVGAPEVWNTQDPSGTSARGAGITVAVIDTGVDYTHPDLGGGFGTGYTVVGGYDFVNDDDDPMDDNGHGTHVAGIIAADAAAPGGITGVAPDASLLAYKVIGADGYGDTSDVVAGLEAAVDPANPHRADVINLSLGSASDGSDPVSQASRAAIAAGVVVVASAGNDGPGSGTVGAPAVVDDVIAVGASISNIRIPVAHVAGDTPTLLQTYRGTLSATPPTEAVTAELVDVGAGSEEEFDAAGDLNGKIVQVNGFVAEAPGDLWQEQIDIAQRAENRGAIALIGGQAAGGGPVSLDTEGDGSVPLAADGRFVPDMEASGDLNRMSSIVVMGMDGTQHAELTRLLGAGPVEITLTSSDVTDGIASFSSRGPTADLRIKPDLVAPGYEIRSTVPTALAPEGQARLSGTSMSAPHVAGAAAILRQLTPDASPADVKAALVGSAAPIEGTAPSVHGSGRLDVAAAAATSLTAAPSSLAFGLADLSRRRLDEQASVTLHNSGDRAQTVALSSDDPAVTFSRRTLSIPAGGDAEVTVRIRMLTPNDPTDIAGWITASSADGSQALVPYLLRAEPLSVQVQPDPNDGHTTVFVGSPTALEKAPEVRIDPPRGRAFDVELEQVNSLWYTADLTLEDDGVYAVTAEGVALSGQALVGDDAFEVRPPDDGSGPWESVGPNATGGVVSVSPGAPGAAVVAQANKAGVWSTDDNGATWNQHTRVPVGLADGGWTLVDPDDPDRWWYAANDLLTGTGKVMRTDDRGTTWDLLPTDGAVIAAFLADESTDTLTVVADGGVQVSHDDGDSWTTVDAGIPPGLFEAAIGGDDLYLTSYSGGVWKVPGITTDTPGQAVQVYDTSEATVVHVVANDDVVALNAWPRGVVTSRDGGATWDVSYDSDRFPNTLFLSGGALVIGDNGILQVSEDLGRTWTEITLPTNRASELDFAQWSDGSVTVATTAGLYRGNLDGTGFERIGLPGPTVHDLAVSGDRILAGTDLGVYGTEIPAASAEWGTADGEGSIGLAANLFASSPAAPDVVWKVRRGAFSTFYVDRSDDGGRTWAESTSATEVPTAAGAHPTDPDRVLIGFAQLSAAGLVATTDGGQTWKNLYHDKVFTAVAGDLSDPNRWWLGTSDGLYRSDDGGVTVTKVASGAVSSILIDDGRIVVAGDTIRTSTDGGRSFRDARTGELPIHVTDLASTGSTLYASTGWREPDGFLEGGRGVLRSTDGGRSWANISTGLPVLDTTALAVSPDSEWLFAATTDGGVQRLPIGGR